MWPAGLDRESTSGVASDEEGTCAGPLYTLSEACLFPMALAVRLRCS